LSAKLVPTFADIGCRVVSARVLHGCILGFLHRNNDNNNNNKILTLSSLKANVSIIKRKRTNKIKTKQSNVYHLGSNVLIGAALTAMVQLVDMYVIYINTEQKNILIMNK
jgi:hypothetical protein